MLLIKINMLEKFSIWFLIVSLILGHIPNILLSRYFGVQFSFYLYDIIIFFIFVQSLFLFKYRNYFVDVLLLLFFLVNLIFLFFNFKFLLGLSSVLYLFRIMVFLGNYPFFCKCYKLFNFRLFSFILVPLHLLIFIKFPNLYLAGYDPHRGRLYGPFFDPNFYSIFLVIIFIFLTKNKEFILKKKINSYHLILILIVMSIFLTYSRAGLLLFMIVLLIYLLKYRIYLLIPFMLGFSFIIASSSYLFRFLLVEGSFDSFFFRVLSYFDGIVIFNTNIFPVGFNNIKLYKYFLTSNINHATAYTDSFILNLILTGGIFNVLLFFVLFVFLLNRLKKLKAGYLTLVLFIIVSSSFVLNTFFHPYFLIITAFLIGFCTKGKRSEGYGLRFKDMLR